MNPKLVLAEILREAVQDVWDGRRDFFALAALPVVALAVIDVVMMLVLGPVSLSAEIGAADEVDPAQAIGPLIHLIIFGITQMALLSVFAVAWHRRYLVPGENPTALQAILWDGRKLRYMLRLIGMSFIAAMFWILPALMITGATGNQGLAAIIFLVGAIVVLGRLYPALAATSVDADARFGHIWALGKGSTFPLIGLTLVPAAVTNIASMVVALPLSGIMVGFGMAGSLTGTFMLNLITGAIVFAGYAVLSTGQSIAWLKLTQKA